MADSKHSVGVPLEGIIDWCSKSVRIRSRLDDTSINSDGAKAIILPQNHPMYFLCSKYGVDNLTSFFLQQHNRYVNDTIYGAEFENNLRDCIGQQYLFDGGYDGKKE